MIYTVKNEWFPKLLIRLVLFGTIILVFMLVSLFGGFPDLTFLLQHFIIIYFMRTDFYYKQNT